MGWDASSIRTCDVNGELLEVGSWRVNEELCVAVVGHQAKPLPWGCHLTGIQKVYVEGTTWKCTQTKQTCIKPTCTSTCPSLSLSLSLSHMKSTHQPMHTSIHHKNIPNALTNPCTPICITHHTHTHTKFTHQPMHTRMHHTHTHTHTHTTWHDTTPHTHTNTHTYPPNPPTWHMMPIVSDDSLVCDGLMSDKRHLVLSCADGVCLVGDVSSISVDGNLHRAFTRRTSIHCAGRLQKSESNVKAKSKRNTTV